MISSVSGHALQNTGAGSCAAISRKIKSFWAFVSPDDFTASMLCSKGIKSKAVLFMGLLSLGVMDAPEGTPYAVKTPSGIDGSSSPPAAATRPIAIATASMVANGCE
jgi:hypothetical protein